MPIPGVLDHKIKFPTTISKSKKPFMEIVSDFQKQSVRRYKLTNQLHRNACLCAMLPPSPSGIWDPVENEAGGSIWRLAKLL